MPAISLTLSDLSMITQALEVHTQRQLHAPEDEPRRKLAGALHDRALATPAGEFPLTHAEALEAAEALDSLVYWEFSDEMDRMSGEVVGVSALDPEVMAARILQSNLEALASEMEQSC